ncbi:MAG: MATE family efflux transporter [Candidatus Omnitrophica bacterium]|nr:MATE family efflux transporter [Candidatus Omnitrophota bacterium]
MKLARLFNDKKLLKESWSVSWPMTLIMFFIFLIGFSDVYVAGIFGKEIQAAYGLASQIYFIFSIIVFALTIGTVSVLSRLFTSGKKEEFDRALESSLILTLLCGAIFSILGFIFSGPVIHRLGVPEELKDYAVIFTRIYSAGLLFSYFLINTNGILRACKMIRNSLWTMFVVALLNIVLNFILALGTPLGFKGIALATVASSAIGCLMNMVFMRRLIDGLRRVSISAAIRILHIGWPAGLLQVLWQLAALALYLILSRFPVHNIEILAAFTNGLKVESAIFLPAFAFNMAAAVLAGNFLGSRRREEAFNSGIVTAIVGVVIVTALSAIAMIFARPIASLLSDNAIVVNECVRYIHISLIFEPFMAWGIILGGALNGAGDTRGVTWIVALSVWLVRLPLSYLLGVYLGFGAVAVWWSMNASIIVQSVFLTRRFFKREWIRHAEALVI